MSDEPIEEAEVLPEISDLENFINNQYKSKKLGADNLEGDSSSECDANEPA